MAKFKSHIARVRICYVCHGLESVENLRSVGHCFSESERALNPYVEAPQFQAASQHNGRFAFANRWSVEVQVWN